MTDLGRAVAAPRASWRRRLARVRPPSPRPPTWRNSRRDRRSQKPRWLRPQNVNMAGPSMQAGKTAGVRPHHAPGGYQEGGVRPSPRYFRQDPGQMENPEDFAVGMARVLRGTRLELEAPKGRGIQAQGCAALR